MIDTIDMQIKLMIEKHICDEICYEKLEIKVRNWGEIVVGKMKNGIAEIDTGPVCKNGETKQNR